MNWIQNILVHFKINLNKFEFLFLYCFFEIYWATVQKKKRCLDDGSVSVPIILSPKRGRYGSGSDLSPAARRLLHAPCRDRSSNGLISVLERSPRLSREAVPPLWNLEGSLALINERTGKKYALLIFRYGIVRVSSVSIPVILSPKRGR